MQIDVGSHFERETILELWEDYNTDYNGLKKKLSFNSVFRIKTSTALLLIRSI